jgi:hypothetical protein
MIGFHVSAPSESSTARRPTAAHEIAAGSTVGCPACGVRGVVQSVGTGCERLTCHTILEPARPVRCADVRQRSEDDVMVTGCLYHDVVSGFTMRCTWGGPGQMMVDGRALRLSQVVDHVVSADSAF